MEPNYFKQEKLTRSFSFASELQEDGTFKGYASVFGVIDSCGTSWAKGCFLNTLSDYQTKKREVPMLWSHDFMEPIGKYTRLEEDEHGLYAEGKILTELPRGNQIYKLMKEGIVTGLSVCVDIDEYEFDKKADLITFTKVKLYEISPCVCPAVDEARIDAVRSFDVRKTENALRFCGLSRSLATKYASLISKEMSNTKDLSNEPLTRKADLEFINTLINKIKQPA